MSAEETTTASTTTATNITRCGTDYVGPVRSQNENCTNPEVVGKCTEPSSKRFCPETCYWHMRDCETGDYNEMECISSKLLCKDTDVDVKNYINKLCPDTCAMTTFTHACVDNPMHCPGTPNGYCTMDDFGTKINFRRLCPQLCGACSTLPVNT